MIINKAELEAVAVKPSQYPPEDLAEIAFAGRSNVGKSSLLNLLVNRKKLAYVSSTPGKTRTINFYRINDNFRIVDLPGYGYAKIPKKVSEQWGEMIEGYLKMRPNIIKVIQLVDIRHEPSKQDVQMYSYLKNYDLDGVVVATKADKISKGALQKHIGVIRKKLSMSVEDIVIPVSSLKKQGHDELLSVMEEMLNMI